MEANDMTFFSSLPSIEAVRELESRMEKMPQVDMQSQMLVHGQMAARAIVIPAKSWATGVVTKKDNISVLFGDVTVTTEAGSVRLTGCNILPASAGFKRVVFAHSDTWWITLHHTEKVELSDIEAEMTDEPENLQTSRFAADFKAALPPVEAPAITNKRRKFRV